MSKIIFDPIMRIDFQENVGEYKLNKVALFNINKISEGKVKSHISMGEYNHNIVIMDEIQFDSLFN